MTKPIKIQRIFPRWSLRGLMILVAILSILMWRAGIGTRYESTVDSIRDGDGDVYFREQNPKFETKSILPVRINGRVVEIELYDGITKYVTYTENGQTVRKPIGGVPRTSIATETSIKHPTRTAFTWFSHDNLDEIEMIYLPIESCTDAMSNRLAKMKNLKGLLLSASKTPRTDADAFQCLAGLVESFPDLEIKTTAKWMECTDKTAE